MIKLKREPTTFERAVWKACSEIPRGEVRSYAWVAERIGKPKAARAVGQALARNPFAPKVPCHRVLPSASVASRKALPGRGLGGYSGSGGLGTKARMLREEGAFRASKG